LAGGVAFSSFVAVFSISLLAVSLADPEKESPIELRVVFKDSQETVNTRKNRNIETRKRS